MAPAVTTARSRRRIRLGDLRGHGGASGGGRRFGRGVTALLVMLLATGMFSEGPTPQANATRPGIAADAAPATTTAAATFPGRNGRIAYTKWWEVEGTPGPDLRFDVFTVRPDGTGNKRLTFSRGSGNPRWAPVGGRIAFERAGAVWVMQGDGSRQQKLVTGELVGWMPNGGRILVVRDFDTYGGSHTDPTWLLYSLSTGAVQQLPIDLPLATGPLYPPYDDDSEWAFVTNEPALSPDGTLLAVVLERNEDTGDGYGYQYFGSIFTVRLDGTALSRVGSYYHPNITSVGWAPGGDELVYQVHDSRFSCLDALWSIRLDGTAGRVDIDEWCAKNYPVWSPNGKKIAFVGGINARVLPPGIHIANPDGSRVRTVLRAEGVYRGQLDWRALR